MHDMRHVCDRLSLRLLALVPLALAACATQQDLTQPGKTSAAASAPDASVAAPASPRGAQSVSVAPPTEQEIQAGIQVLHIGATASGGLVDVRFKVLDGAKASALLADPANAPQIIVGDKPPLLPPHHAMHGGRMSKDQTLFIMYPNIRKAVEPGVDVYVAFGATRLGPVKAQ
jgi:hypothetical protein